jgi:chromosome partitioning protein
VGTGSVTLVETPAPAVTTTPPVAPSSVSAPTTEAPMAHPTTSTSSAALPPQRRIEETISDVATAHAELDNVLPPTAAPPTASPAEEQPEAPGPERVSDTPVAPRASAVVAHEPDPVVETVETVEVIESSESMDTGPENVVTGTVLTQPTAAPLKPATPAPARPTPPAATASDELSKPEPTGEPVREPQSASGNPLPRVLAVANQKGGVGKTTTSVNLGAALAELGFRVLVIDLDPQGNATTGLGIDARNFELSMYDVLMRDSSMEDCVEPTSMKNLFVAPATIALAGAEIELVPAFSRELKLKKSIESIIDDFDYVLIDCPPSLGLITVNALAAADEVLVPIQCEYYALEGLSQLMRNVHLVASNLNPQLDISTIVLTMYDARTKLADQVANEVRLHFGAKVCRNVIPRTVRLSEAPSFGQPITAFDPASRGAIAYRELAKEVSGGTT